MRSLSYFSLLLMAVFLAMNAAGCKRDGEGSLQIRFTALYGTSAFQLLTDYPTPTSDDSVSFHTLNFLLSGIRLIDKDNKEVSIFSGDAFFVDFSNASSLNISIDEIPTGEYKSIRFGIGVPASINDRTPSQFPATSPLGDVGNYWAAWDSYIFSRVEGTLDTSRTSASTLPYLYHGGANSMYRERTIEREFSIVDGSATSLLLTLQAREIFYPTGGDAIDIRALNVSHSAAEGTPAFEVARSVVQNIANAIQ